MSDVVFSMATGEAMLHVCQGVCGVSDSHPITWAQLSLCPGGSMVKTRLCALSLNGWRRQLQLENGVSIRVPTCTCRECHGCQKLVQLDKDREAPPTYPSPYRSRTTISSIPDDFIGECISSSFTYLSVSICFNLSAPVNKADTLDLGLKLMTFSIANV